MNATEQQTDTPSDLGAGSGPADEDEQLTKDDVFHLLQNQRRRDVLRYLQGVEGPVAMREMAEQVAAWEHDTTLQALTSDECQRVYIALYQTHLPKLDEEGIINYNQSRGIVERTPLADELQRYLDTERIADEDADEEVQWSSYQLGVSVIGMVLLVSSASNLPTIGMLSGFQTGVVIFTMFALVTVAQLVSESEQFA
ncbi:DUF7344 domain-containing protein [Halorussus halophilus]|uniref:DUF7344 domain-containing protein n=1 Tax=Halorussus halophilus TaxID=2650975 RepID=UPI0013010517|nr:hypothetical protein [Halorussus halophilus]